MAKIITNFYMMVHIVDDVMVVRHVNEAADGSLDYGLLDEDTLPANQRALLENVANNVIKELEKDDD